MRTESKPEGFAISKIYPGALISSRGVVYEVTDVNIGNPINLEKDTYDQIQEMIEVVSDIILPDYPDIDGQSVSDIVRLINEFNTSVQIHRIDGAFAEISENLRMFRCSKCGYFNDIGYFKYGRCPKCRSRPIQSPVSVLKIPAANLPNPEIIQAMRVRWCPSCRSKGSKNIYSMLPGAGSSTAPLANLLWKCPDCNRTDRIFAPKNYKLGFLSEEYTRAITVSTANIKEAGPELDHGGLLSSYIKKISYIPEVEVTSLTPGYRVGSSYRLQATKRFPNNRVYGRQFSTKGILFELDPEVYSECIEYAKKVYHNNMDVFNNWLEKEIENPLFDQAEQELRIKRWVLHSFVHGLLSMISEKTELERTKFAGTYDHRKNTAIVYDNEFGGIGGVESLAEDNDAFLDYLELCRHTIEGCDCRFQCPRCLYGHGCGEVNQALFRHLLGPIYDVDTFYL
jgi:predicted Zn-ribbon and HTH transcriptional regulator